ncbi:hypothetical protein KIH41_04415 [Litoribacter ruber]|uniref:hypothetical protein n=1 Tax=Litoribacter ruber TaxID=702568 RepID=UPI001BD96666|nr:hypothetical protein [Litoribacter ruber]MBT0810517.1 hypothetical protein [Litoribacter ruber]
METVENTAENQPIKPLKCLFYLPKAAKIKIPASTEKVETFHLFYGADVDDETLNFKFLMPAVEEAKNEDYDIILGFDKSLNRIIIGYKNTEGRFQAFNAHQQAALISDHLIQQVIWDRPFGESGMMIIKSVILSDQLDGIATKNGVPVKTTHSGFDNLMGGVKANMEAVEKIIAFDDRNTVILNPDADKNSQSIFDMWMALLSDLAEKEKSMLDRHIDLQVKYRLYLEKTFQITRDTSIKKIFDKFRTKPPVDDLADELVLISDYKKQTFHNKLTGRKGTLELEARNMVQIEYSSGLKLTVELEEGETQMSIHLSKYTNFAFKPKYAEIRKGLHDSLLKTVVILGKM